MKKSYMKPVVEKIEFDYTSVVVTSGCGIAHTYSQYSDGCTGTQTGSYGNPTQSN